MLMRFPKKAKLGILPIGSEGYLMGQMVRVVGYMHRKEQGTRYDWREYMLLLPDKTYAQLAEYQGHWTYIRPLAGTYVQYGTGGKRFYVDVGERQYRLYNKYKPETLLALGEFDWNVLDDDKLTVSEYINPPYSLTGEEDGKRTDWYKGNYLTPKQVATAFGLTAADLPATVGTGAAEPPYSQEKWEAVLAFTGMALVVLICVQLLLMVFKPSDVLLKTNFTAEREPGSTANQFKPVVTASFTVDGPAALAIDLSVDVDNQWVELPISVVNETTGQSFELTKVIEYYHGRDGGENWTEGSRTDDAELSRIPAGRYHVNLYPIAEGMQTVTGSVQIVQNPTIFSNFLIITSFLFLYPLYLLARRSALESSRWQNSDFADDE